MLNMLPPDFIRLGWRTLWRDLRAGDLRLLILAVTLAVAALTAVGFFADRLKSGLQRDARQMLGGDAVVQSDLPTPKVFTDKAAALGLQTTAHLGFPTMARATEARGGAAKLVALKAVGAGYPLRGRLQLVPLVSAERDSKNIANFDTGHAGTGISTVGVPISGTVWVGEGLLDALGMSVGDTLRLGESALTVTRVIAVEPDRGAGFVNFAPRVMVNMADLAATQLVQPASRITYRFAVAAKGVAPSDERAVAQFVEWANALLKTDVATDPSLRGVRIESLETGRPEMRQTLDRAEKFLNLVAPWRWRWRRGGLPPSTWTTAPCCACWA
jgi:putative ABC transport system permease protein